MIIVEPIACKRKLYRNDSVFKMLHQRFAPSRYYALDSDLILIEKIPPDTVYPVAVLEFKIGDETITFTQVIYFNHIVSIPPPWNIPVYIIRAHLPFITPPPDTTLITYEYEQLAREQHRFDIYQYQYGDWKPEPPRIQVATVAQNINWQELVRWEETLRQERRKTIETYAPRPNSQQQLQLI